MKEGKYYIAYSKWGQWKNGEYKQYAGECFELLSPPPTRIKKALPKTKKEAIAMAQKQIAELNMANTYLSIKHEKHIDQEYRLEGVYIKIY